MVLGRNDVVVTPLAYVSTLGNADKNVAPSTLALVHNIEYTCTWQPIPAVMPDANPLYRLLVDVTGLAPYTHYRLHFSITIMPHKTFAFTNVFISTLGKSPEIPPDSFSVSRKPIH